MGEAGPLDALPARDLEGDASDVGMLDRAAAGEAGLRLCAGEAGRANLVMAGLPGLGSALVAAMRVLAGDKGAGAAAGFGPSAVLGPGTRLSRSSSWVLSLAEREPMRAQIFSPTNVYTSLEKTVSCVDKGASQRKH